jgi:hypothetical protein
VLDIGFLDQPWEYFHSPGILTQGLVGAGWGRKISVDLPVPQSLAKRYKWDDWDLLAMHYPMNLHDIVLSNHGVWEHVPTIYLVHGAGVTITGSAKVVFNSPATACAEAASMLSATTVWMGSESHKSIVLAHYKQFFHEDVVDNILQKIDVVSLGIDVPKVVRPRKIKEPLVISFPHRSYPSATDKGKVEFIAYCKALRKAAPNLRVLVRMLQTPRTPVWPIDDYVEVERHGPLHRTQLFELFQDCDIVFSSARQETWGLVVMEAIANGCRPILPDRLSYPELHPSEHLYDSESIDHAVQMTLGAMGTTFDNSYTEQYLWANVVSQWHDMAHRAYNKVFEELPHLTKAGSKMQDYLIGKAVCKKDLMGYMGWGQLRAWGKYRAMLKGAGVSITKGPDPLYGSGVASQRLF